MIEKDISIIVVDAVSPDIDESSDIALSTIQGLVNSGLTSKIYEFRAGASYLNSTQPIKALTSRYTLDEITSDIVLVGGSLGNKHYDALWQILNQARSEGKTPTIHVPLDCTYSFTGEYDSGESWTDGCLGHKDMKILDGYKKNSQVALYDRWESMNTQIKNS